MSATTTSGKPLSLDNLNNVVSLANELLHLDTAKSKILSYVESQMMRIAPNLSNLLGPSVAARLVGLAGGITNLSRMPAGNIQVS